MCDKNLNNPGGRQTSPTDSPVYFNPGLYDPLSCLPAVEDVLESGDVFKGRNSINIVEEILHRVRQLKLVSSKIKKNIELTDSEQMLVQCSLPFKSSLYAPV